MKIHIVSLGFVMLISACQTAIPFYEKNADEPEWFKAKTMDANAQKYPAARAVPPRPTGQTTQAARDAELTALEKVGAEVRNHPRAALKDAKKTDIEAFARKAQEETIVPPPVDDDTRPD